jgi:hypothetical protein
MAASAKERDSSALCGATPTQEMAASMESVRPSVLGSALRVELGVSRSGSQAAGVQAVATSGSGNGRTWSVQASGTRVGCYKGERLACGEGGERASR